MNEQSCFRLLGDDAVGEEGTWGHSGGEGGEFEAMFPGKGTVAVGA